MKHIQWIYSELEILEKAGIIALSISPWSSPIATVPKKPQPGKISQNDYALTITH